MKNDWNILWGKILTIKSIIESENGKYIYKTAQINILGIEKGKEIADDHLMSIIMYTDLTNQQSVMKFSYWRKTVLNKELRIKIKQEKEELFNEHEKYSHWSRLLKECCMVYGIEYNNNNKDNLYNGVIGVRRLNVRKPLVIANYPLSTTTKEAIAQNLLKVIKWDLLQILYQ